MQTTIQELMALNPLKHTNETLDKIVAEMRSMRHAFNAGNKKAGTTKPKKAKASDLPDDLLGLEIKL